MIDNADFQALAFNSLLESEVLGLGLADASQKVKAKRGLLANALTVDKPICDLFPLFGMQRELDLLKEQHCAKIAIPRVAVMDSPIHKKKFSIEVIWNASIGGYIILMHADETLPDEMNVRLRRVERIAVESFYTGASYKPAELIPLDLPKMVKPEPKEEAQVKKTRGTAKAKAERLNPVASLTERQQEVVKLLVKGCSNKVIAFKLNISEKTVEVHRSRAIRRLGVRTSAELIRLAGEFGLS